MEKQQIVPLSRFQKVASPSQYYSLFRKSQSHKAKLLKQLEQLELDTQQYRNMPLTELQNRADEMLRRTYSFKYIGVKDNQIGILSKRVRPENFKKDLLPEAKPEYLVTGFFFPKPLKTVTKHSEKTITVDNLEQEIKKFFPKHSPKVIEHPVKVRGSWNNLQCADRNPKHLVDTDPDLSKKPKKPQCLSYSRILQNMKSGGENIKVAAVAEQSMNYISKGDMKERGDLKATL